MDFKCCGKEPEFIEIYEEQGEVVYVLFCKKCGVYSGLIAKKHCKTCEYLTDSFCQKKQESINMYQPFKPCNLYHEIIN